MGTRVDAGTHTVVALADGQVLEEKAGVTASELGHEVLALRARYGENARILVEGPETLVRTVAEGGMPIPPARPMKVVAAETGTIAGVELAHAMLWDTYDRATRIQAWMLNQASTYTLELLENNKRLADQASELQKRFQSSMAEIDYMTREKAMMDAEASASRYSRHLIEKARAEAEAARAPRSAGEWVDELVDGVALALGVMCGARAPKDPWNSN